MMVKKLLGDVVKEERLRRKLSQNTLAEQANVSLRNFRYRKLCCQSATGNFIPSRILSEYFPGCDYS